MSFGARNDFASNCYIYCQYKSSRRAQRDNSKINLQIEIGNMKHGWEIKKLGEVCEINYGTRVVQKIDGGTKFPVYGGGGATFKIDRFNREDCLIVARFAMSSQCVRFVKGKFFLNDSGLTIKSNDSALSQAYLDKHIIALNDKIYSLGKGAAQKNLDIKALKSLNIYYPINIPEQERIVSELDCINGILEKKREQIKELDALAQSIFYDMFGDPIQNEKGWEVKKLGEISIVKIGPFGSLLHTSDYISGGTPLVNPVHMQDEKICPDIDFTVSKEKLSELQNYLLQEGDIVFARRGDIGRCALVRDTENGFLCGTGSLYVRIIEDVDRIFFIKVMRSSSMIKLLNSFAKGATMLNINCKIIENLPIPLPPLSLQQVFSAKIEAIEKQKELVKRSIAETETLLASRMQHYFSEE